MKMNNNNTEKNRNENKCPMNGNRMKILTELNKVKEEEEKKHIFLNNLTTQQLMIQFSIATTTTTKNFYSVCVWNFQLWNTTQHNTTQHTIIIMLFWIIEKKLTN